MTAEQRFKPGLIQNIAKVHITYIFVFGQTHPSNEKNTFGDTVAKACEYSSKMVKTRPVCLNASMDDVLCYSSWCQIYIDSYLQDYWNAFEIIHIHRTVKKSRYQLIDGLCTDIMGSYVFDPWLFKMAIVANELWSIQS